MTILGLDLNDAALTGVADDELLFSEPGYALAPDGQLDFGSAAWAQARRYPRRVQNRYWRELSDDAIAAPVGSAESTADLVHDHLAKLWDQYGGGRDGVALAVPSYWSPGQLALLLGIGEEVGLTVRAIVDQTIASTRREYPGRALLAIDVSLHEATVSEIGQDGCAVLNRRHHLPGLGIEALERAVVERIAATFVDNARFDPLHHADSEQFLYDHLYSWLMQLGRDSGMTATIGYRDNEFTADLERDALAARVADLCEPLLQQVRALLPAGGATAIQLAGKLGDFPGLAAALSALPDVEVFLLDPTAAARGVLRDAARAGAGDAYRLQTTMTWDQPPAPATGVPATAAAEIAAPTHLVFGSQAFRLGSRALSIGMELSPGDFGIQLSGRMTGISRQHCSVHHENGRVVLTDHSRYGTNLNGHRIQTSAVLQAGDVISIGSPAREFVLVAETDPNGT
ncbi:MAG: FHA domain-containing protein [Gammaproteobacteria bacterium]|nr:FHA domain-containing protein [Gammaproteobacteria bacterium]